MDMDKQMERLDLIDEDINSTPALPQAVLEKVLDCLPIPDLETCRLVSHEWKAEADRLISLKHALHQIEIPNSPDPQSAFKQLGALIQAVVSLNLEKKPTSQYAVRNLTIKGHFVFGQIPKCIILGLKDIICPALETLILNLSINEPEDIVNLFHLSWNHLHTIVFQGQVELLESPGFFESTGNRESRPIIETLTFIRIIAMGQNQKLSQDFMDDFLYLAPNLITFELITWTVEMNNSAIQALGRFCPRLENVRFWTLDDNNFRELAKLNQLKRLHTQYVTCLEGIEEFLCRHTRLVYLYLGSSRFETNSAALDAPEFPVLPNLKYLKLLDTLPDFTSRSLFPILSTNFPSLKGLQIPYSDGGTIAFWGPTLYDQSVCSSLEQLELSHFHSSRIPESLSVVFPNLKKLRCPLTVKDLPLVWTWLSNLEEFIIDGNLGENPGFDNFDVDSSILGMEPSECKTLFQKSMSWLMGGFVPFKERDDKYIPRTLEGMPGKNIRSIIRHQPSICDMIKLKYIQVNKAWADRMSIVTIKAGFLMMQNLQFVLMKDNSTPIPYESIVSVSALGKTTTDQGFYLETILPYHPQRRNFNGTNDISEIDKKFLIEYRSLDPSTSDSDILQPFKPFRFGEKNLKMDNST